MTSEPEPRTLFIPLDLGAAAQYDETIFPRIRFKGDGPLEEVDLALEGTLNEIFRIRKMAANTEHFRDLVADTKSSYDRLLLKRDKLEKQQKSINPLKLFSAYRSARVLAEAGKKLYHNTRTTSDRLRRQIVSVSSINVEHVQNDDLPSDARISGIAVPLESPLDESTAALVTEAASFIASQVNRLSEGDPFADDFRVDDSGASTVGIESSAPADSATDGDGVTPQSSSRLSGALSSSISSLGQGSGNTYMNVTFNNSYFASRSTIHTPTLNHGGSHNQGSSSTPNLQAQNSDSNVTMRPFSETHLPDEANYGGKSPKGVVTPRPSHMEADGNSLNAVDDNSDAYSFCSER